MAKFNPNEFKRSLEKVFQEQGREAVNMLQRNTIETAMEMEFPEATEGGWNSYQPKLEAESLGHGHVYVTYDGKPLCYMSPPEVGANEKGQSVISIKSRITGRDALERFEQVKREYNTGE